MPVNPVPPAETFRKIFADEADAELPFDSAMQKLGDSLLSQGASLVAEAIISSKGPQKIDLTASGKKKKRTARVAKSVARKGMLILADAITKGGLGELRFQGNPANQAAQSMVARGKRFVTKSASRQGSTQIRAISNNNNNDNNNNKQGVSNTGVDTAFSPSQLRKGALGATTTQAQTSSRAVNGVRLSARRSHKTQKSVGSALRASTDDDATKPPQDATHQSRTVVNSGTLNTTLRKTMQNNVSSIDVKANSASATHRAGGQSFVKKQVTTVQRSQSEVGSLIKREFEGFTEEDAHSATIASPQQSCHFRPPSETQWQHLDTRPPEILEDVHYMPNDDRGLLEAGKESPAKLQKKPSARLRQKRARARRAQVKVSCTQALASIVNQDAHKKAWSSRRKLLAVPDFDSFDPDAVTFTLCGATDTEVSDACRASMERKHRQASHSMVNVDPQAAERKQPQQTHSKEAQMRILESPRSSLSSQDSDAIAMREIFGSIEIYNHRMEF